MKTFLLAVVMLVVPQCCAAGEPWDGADYALGGVAAIGLIVDWGQTRYIAKNPQFYEKNAVLRDRPSVGKVDAYFATALIGTVLIADWLKPENRKTFLAAIAIMELTIVGRNKSLGIKVSFN